MLNVNVYQSKTLVLDHFLVKTSEYLSFNLLLKDCSFDSSENLLGFSDSENSIDGLRTKRSEVP